MKNLLSSIPYDKLLGPVDCSRLIEAKSLLTPLLEDHHATGDASFLAAEAYCLGVMQGVHDERRRKNQGRLEYLTNEERQNLYPELYNSPDKITRVIRPPFDEAAREDTGHEV